MSVSLVALIALLPAFALGMDLKFFFRLFLTCLLVYPFSFAYPRKDQLQQSRIVLGNCTIEFW